MGHWHFHKMRHQHHMGGWHFSPWMFMPIVFVFFAILTFKFWFPLLMIGLVVGSIAMCWRGWGKSEWREGWHKQGEVFKAQWKQWQKQWKISPNTGRSSGVTGAILPMQTRMRTNIPKSANSAQMLFATTTLSQCQRRLTKMKSPSASATRWTTSKTIATVLLRAFRYP